MPKFVSPPRSLGGGAVFPFVYSRSSIHCSLKTCIIKHLINKLLAKTFSIQRIINRFFICMIICRIRCIMNGRLYVFLFLQFLFAFGDFGASLCRRQSDFQRYAAIGFFFRYAAVSSILGTACDLYVIFLSFLKINKTLQTKKIYGEKKRTSISHRRQKRAFAVKSFFGALWRVFEKPAKKTA